MQIISIIITTINVILTIGIAIYMARIAKGQYRLSESQYQLAAQKLKWDMFKKRFEVYEMVIHFMPSAALRPGDAGAAMAKDFDELGEILKTARFLFDNELYIQLCHYLKKAREFRKEFQQGKEPSHNELFEIMKKIEDTFIDYMSFAHWK